MNIRHLSDSAIAGMADAALTSFEWNASWRKAGEAAREHAADELGVRATTAQVGLAVRLAQTRWQGLSFDARRNAGGAA